MQFTSVGRALLKSAPARVVRGERGYRVEGVAWGAPIDRVEVRIDGGPWQPATTGRRRTPARGLRVAALGPRPGAVGRRGAHRQLARLRPGRERVQPAPDDPVIANKLTYWESNGQITRRVRIA